MFNFLHIELTSRCNKSCWMCGRRKIERDHPSLVDWGDMPFDMVKSIAEQVPARTVVQFHNNGEPTLYPYLGMALYLFRHCFRSFNTNGKLLVEKADRIIGNLERLVISVVERDLEGDLQYRIVREFLDRKGDRKPFMVYRLLGEVYNPKGWRTLPGRVITRTLHNPMGSRDYKKPVTIPEIGVCLDFLTHLAIDRYGYASICVRFDPYHVGRIGHLKEMTLQELWERKFEMWGEAHFSGQRDKVPLCKTCQFWGCPVG